MTAFALAAGSLPKSFRKIFEKFSKTFRKRKKEPKKEKISVEVLKEGRAPPLFNYRNSQKGHAMTDVVPQNLNEKRRRVIATWLALFAETKIRNSEDELTE